jgi:hypothetical protein
LGGPTEFDPFRVFDDSGGLDVMSDDEMTKRMQKQLALGLIREMRCVREYS